MFPCPIKQEKPYKKDSSPSSRAASCKNIIMTYKKKLMKFSTIQESRNDLHMYNAGYKTMWFVFYISLSIWSLDIQFEQFNINI